MIATILALGCTPEVVAPAPEPVEPEDSAAPVDPMVGPQNRWPHALQSQLPPWGILGDGWDDGDLAFDFIGVDQYGDEVSLYQFYGRPMVVSLVYNGCAPCSPATNEHEAFWAANNTLPLMTITILLALPDASLATAAQANSWGGLHFATHPVLADTTGVLTEWAAHGIPGAGLIDWALRIVESEFDPPDYNQLLFLSEDAPGTYGP